MNMHEELSLQDVREAARCIKPYVVRTPLLYERKISEILGCQAYVKPEILQVTGAFKMRGAVNKILSLTQEERERGIICSSSGNHGQACALVGKMLGIRVVVVLPEDVPRIKADKARELGAEVVYGPRLYDARWKMVQELQEKNGYTIVHGYEDYKVMAGQGTVGLEILEDAPYIQTVVVPVGGGGLIAGVATAVKECNPAVRVVGVQAKASDGYVQSRKAGHPVEVPCYPSLADGLGCRKPGINPYPICEDYVDDFVSVTEESIREAVKIVGMEAKLVAEPSSCVGIAAVLEKALPVAPDERVAFILTSGNWDIDMIGKIYNDEPVEGSL